jgi:mono/diheme cytochrome c family protein
MSPSLLPKTERDRPHPSTVAAAVLIGATLLFAVTPLYAQEAAETYSQKCASCHGADGKGDGPTAQYLNPKPSDFAVSLKGKSDAWIAKSITGGGPAVGESSIMPSYPNLSVDQTKALEAYVRHLH